MRSNAKGGTVQKYPTMCTCSLLFLHGLRFLYRGIFARFMTMRKKQILASGIGKFLEKIKQR